MIITKKRLVLLLVVPYVYFDNLKRFNLAHTDDKKVQNMFSQSAIKVTSYSSYQKKPAESIYLASQVVPSLIKWHMAIK
jgi:hypothetical protein